MNIYESIAAVQSDVDFIGKDKKAQTQNYKYRGVDQVLNTLHPLFARHKVFSVPDVLDIPYREIRQTKNGGEMTYQVVKVKYTFYAEDGSNLSATVLGEAMDSGDKVSNKCMSVAYKYACFQILSIPTEETCADPDDMQEEFGKGGKTPQEPRRAPQTGAGGEEKPRRGITLTELRNFGVNDITATAKAIGEKFGKTISELDEEETARAWRILEKAKAKAEEAAEYRRAAEEDDTLPPWDEKPTDEDGNPL